MGLPWLLAASCLLPAACCLLHMHPTQPSLEASASERSRLCGEVREPTFPPRTMLLPQPRKQNGSERAGREVAAPRLFYTKGGWAGLGQIDERAFMLGARPPCQVTDQTRHDKIRPEIRMTTRTRVQYCTSESLLCSATHTPTHSTALPA